MFIANEASESFASRPETKQEREIYAYIRQIARQSDSKEAIKQFYDLLFRGIPNPALDSDKRVLTSLRYVLNSKDIGTHLPYIFNRCFYTIGNLWRLDAHRHSYLRDLIHQASEVFSCQPKSQVTRHLVKGMKSYVNNEHLYLPLQRQMLLLKDDAAVEPESLSGCFKDYFFIHESVAVTPDVAPAYREAILKQRQQNAQKLKQKLITFRECMQGGSSEKLVNPTRLSNQELKKTIDEFDPDRPNSYLKQAQSFNDEHGARQSTDSFIKAFHGYLMRPLIAVSETYGSNHVSRAVWTTLLDGIKSSKARITDISINLMCTRVLKLLVSNTVDNPDIGQFKNLISQAGHQALTAVLLKIVLFKRTIRSWFEDRFGILFHKWASFPIETIGWLVKSFEYMNVALALNAQWVNYIPHSR